MGVWTTVGRQAGNHIDAVNTALVRGAPLLGLIVLVLIVVYVVRRRRARRSAATVEDAPDEAPEQRR